MKSGWVDRDAEAIVARRREIGHRPRSSRCASTRRGCSAAIRKLVLHGGGNTSLKAAHARPPRRRGRGAARQSHRRRHGDDRARRPAGGAACADAQAARARARSTTTNLSASSAPSLIDPAARQSVGRDDAARVPAAQIRRSHPRHRRAQRHRPARRRKKMRRGFRRPARLRALPHAGLRPGQKGDRSFRARQSRATG